MPSKQVTDHEKLVTAVTTTIDEHGAAVATELHARFSPLLEPGEKAPDHALELKLIARSIRRTAAALSAADEANLGEQSATVVPRHTRDVSALAVREIYVDLRDTVGTVHGPEAQAALGLKDPASPDPLVLSKQAQTAIDRLNDSKIQLGAQKRRGSSFDRHAFSEDLHAALPALLTALGAVAKEASLATATQAAKNAAFDAAEAALSHGSALALALFTAAGKEELFPHAHRAQSKATTPAATPDAVDPAKKG